MPLRHYPGLRFESDESMTAQRDPVKASKNRKKLQEAIGELEKMMKESK